MMRKSWIMAVGTALVLGGCGGSLTLPSLGVGVEENNQSAGGGDHFIYQGHDFGPDRNTEYRQGVMDGCRTAGGTYSKNHALFRDNTSYRAGWEHGRLHCKK